jgi:hypothetical protein
LYYNKGTTEGQVAAVLGGIISAGGAALCGIPRKTKLKAGITMTTIIIRQDEPEEELIFPARRSPRRIYKKITVCDLNCYVSPAILKPTRTNVRDAQLPKS